MLVDDKKASRFSEITAGMRAGRLRCALERALGPIRGKGIGLGAGHGANLA
jgi:hypothetical protein